MNSRRIASLDYLRGVMALSVMVYHYTVWSGVEIASDSLLSKLGIYAVAVFYILSGLSLAIVYKGRINTKTDIAQFFVRRIFRIAPLFWISVVSTLLLGYIGAFFNNESFHVDNFRLFLNFSLLFGFVEPTAYLSTGAWSIGNEVVFYTAFPFFILTMHACRQAIPFALIICVILGTFFSTYLINSSQPLTDQWAIYINPLNQIFLFFGGVALGIYTKPTGRELAAGVAAIAFIVFLLFPIEGDRVGLVSGFGRFVLSLCCFAFVWTIYAVQLEFEGFIAKALAFFGEGCYSIYLLHPLVAVPIIYIADRMGLGLVSAYCVACFATLLTCWVTFTFIERPMIQIGSEVAKTLQNRQRKQ